MATKTGTNMKLNRVLFLTTATLLEAISCGAQAESLRCDGQLASVGDSKAAIFDKCGEPQFRESFCAASTSGAYIAITPVIATVPVITAIPAAFSSHGCQRVDEWTYNPGSGQFLAMLQFERGILKSIRRNERAR
jgi:hypothetical protein